MYKRYTKIKLSTNVKKALDELSPPGKNYSEAVRELVKNARLLRGLVNIEREIKSHEVAARIAMEKAASIKEILGEITNRPLIHVATYDHDSTYSSAQEKSIEGEVLEFDYSKKRSKFEKEARLYLVQGSPNKGIIEVIKDEGSNSTDWIVNYIGLTPFKIIVKSSKKETKKIKPQKGLNIPK